MLKAFDALGYALSARALLAFSLLGAFVLAGVSMFVGWRGLAVLGLYCLMTVLPVVFLEWKKVR